MTIEWASELFADDLVAVDLDPDFLRCFLRFRGNSKEFITIWITFRALTVSFETYLMPAPEENSLECLTYLMKRNHKLCPLHLGIGPEAAIYLVGSTPLAGFDRSVLDEMVGASIAYAEEIFPTAMGIGYGSRYRPSR